MMTMMTMMMIKKKKKMMTMMMMTMMMMKKKKKTEIRKDIIYFVYLRVYISSPNFDFDILFFSY